jgi:azurin
MKPAALAVVASAALCTGCFSGSDQPQLIKIIGNDDMKFDITHFEVKPGQKVIVTLTDTGELPKEAMAHNWVLLEKGTDAAKLVAEGAEHPESDYIPSSQAVHLLAKTKLLGPGDFDSVTFTAPTESGSYEYICAFPAHYAAGMKGVMTVTAAGK